ncbi:MAG: hypothetical protein ABI687_02635 [Flavitalea sp.]
MIQTKTENKEFLSDSRLRTWVFLFFLGVIVVHHLFVFLGFYGNDDINYARYAAMLAHGQSLTIQTADHFELRWLPIYTTAFFYRLFGINEFTTAAFGSISLALTGLYIKKLLRQAPLWTYILALILFFLNYRIIFNTHRLLPDTGICLFIFGAYYYYLNALEGARPIANAAVAALFIFLAIITKETIILPLPLFIFLFVRDFRCKQMNSFWATALPLLSALIFAYLLLFRINTGEWFYRYTLLQGNTYDSDCNFAGLPFSETFKRIGYYLWEAFLRNGDLLYLIFGLCGFFYRNKVMPSKAAREITLAFFILLLSANFMSISIKSYIPLCHDTRHYLFLFPFAAISGGSMLFAYIKEPRKYLPVLALPWLATIVLFSIGGGSIKFLYLLVSLLLLVLFFAGSIINTRKLTIGFVILLAGSMSLRPLYDLYHNEFSYYYDHKKLVTETFSGSGQDAVIFTGDDLTAAMSEYFLKYNSPSVLFKNLYATDSLSYIPANKVYLLINQAYNKRMSTGVIELSRSGNSSAIRLICSSGPVYVYAVEDIKALEFLKPYAGSVH